MKNAKDSFILRCFGRKKSYLKIAVSLNADGAFPSHPLIVQYADFFEPTVECMTHKSSANKKIKIKSKKNLSSSRKFPWISVIPLKRELTVCFNFQGTLS